MDVWTMTVKKRDLVDALDNARPIDVRRKRLAANKAFPLFITATATGLSFRSQDAGVDIPATGTWPSPIRVAGAMLHALAPRLSGPAIVLAYADGQMTVGTTRFPATEV